MSEARDLLLLLLSSLSTSEPPPISTLPPSALTAINVTKPPPIPSVQSFEAQLVVGGKDESLRKASNLFKVAAESMEITRAHDKRYWANALRIRRQNWGLLPAPLPFGSATGKGADRTSKDFLVSFGMEGCKLCILVCS
jgi:mediator of RNA polymerase II transcription subunit 17, fungi type